MEDFAVVYDVRGIDIHEETAAHCWAGKEQGLVFVLLAHETVLKLLVEKPLALKKRHGRASDSPVPWCLAVGRGRLAQGAVSGKFTRILNLFQVTLDAFLAKHVCALCRDTVLGRIAPANKIAEAAGDGQWSHLVQELLRAVSRIY